MINELYGLSKALESVSIDVETWCQGYEKLPNVTPQNPCVRIWIGENGVDDIEDIHADLANKLRKYIRGTSGGSFPGMYLTPLYRITDGKQVDKINQMKGNESKIDIAEICSWCVQSNWDEKFQRNLKRCLNGAAQKLLDEVERVPQPEKQELIALVTYLHQNYDETKYEQLHSDLKRLLLQKLEKRDNTTLALTLLFQTCASNETKRKDVSVIWDISSWRDYGYPIASEHFTRMLNQGLLDLKQRQQIDEKNTVDDAFHAPFLPSNKPMPSVKLAGGFVTKIYTMFEGQPCQNRYANFDRKVTSFPLAPENRTFIKKALEWISASDKQGETWLKIDEKEILFSCASKLPDIPTRLVGFFKADAKAESSRNTKRYCAQTSKIIQCLKGLPPEEKPEHICVFVIRKIDDGRRKLVFTRNTTPDQLITAATAWQEGCCNLPDFDCAKKNSELLEVPYPVDVADIMNQVWKIDGKTATQGKTAVHAMRYYQGIELLLDHSPTAANRHYLNVFLAHYMNLAAWYGNMLYSGKRQAAYSQEKQLMKALPVLALLLHQHNIRKEQYMESYPYLLGQILKISDELHALYCRVVRDGKLPSQLAGNALYNAAAETPSMAFALLGRRMTPYIAWAKRYARENIDKKEEESWRAGWLMNVYCKTADQLEIVLTPQKRFDDYEKAQLFLGYLASLPKKKEKNTQPNTNDTNLEEAKNE